MGVARHRLPVVEVSKLRHAVGVPVGIEAIRIVGIQQGGVGKRYLRAVSVFCGAQILPHPALFADPNSVIGVSVIVLDGGDAAEERPVGGETHLLAVRRDTIVGGVCPHVVEGVRGQSGQGAREGPQSRAVVRVCIGDSRVWRNTPTDTPCGDRLAAVVDHYAAADGCAICDGTDAAGCHRWSGDHSQPLDLKLETTI